MPPHIERMYYRCTFYIMSGIVILLLLQLSWLITYHMVVLYKDSSKPFFACIGTYHKIFLWICNFQYWCTSENILQPLEAFFTLRSPFELHPLLLQRSDGMCNLRESFNESPVVSCKLNKISYICHISWSRPIHNGFNLLMVYKYSSYKIMWPKDWILSL